jgi:hypothetical protein
VKIVFKVGWGLRIDCGPLPLVSCRACSHLYNSNSRVELESEGLVPP